MKRTFKALLGLAVTIAAHTAPGADVLFSEEFEDTNLTKRGWYDGDKFRIASDARAGKGCIEYEWLAKDSQASSSSGVRRLFEPTDEIHLRFYLKLSKGWGWTGRDYHPHLTHFMTTENTKWHGPAASHLTVYIEPVNGKLRLAATDIQNQKAPHGLTQGELKGGYNGKMYDSAEVLFNDDQWHCIEACFKLNTLDPKNDRPNRDGVIRGWFDGTRCRAHRCRPALDGFPRDEVQPVPGDSVFRPRLAPASPETLDRRTRSRQKTHRSPPRRQGTKGRKTEVSRN